VVCGKHFAIRLDVIALTILLRKVTHTDFSEIAFDCERLRDKGLLKAKNARLTKIDKGRSTTKPIKPDLQDFDAVTRAYCRKRHISLAKLCARFDRDDKLAADLYQLAQAAKLAR
jgi:hypothetical protein